jgi:hypothetical protein
VLQRRKLADNETQSNSTETLSIFTGNCARFDTLSGNND